MPSQEAELTEAKEAADQDREQEAAAGIAERAAGLEAALQQAQQALRSMQQRHEASQRQLVSMQVRAAGVEWFFGAHCVCGA